jgi:hypothetical protein
MARARTFLDAFLEDNPDILFGALRPQTASRSFTDYWRTREGAVRGDYLAGLGRSAMQGGISKTNPGQKYSDFLGDYPWEAFWQGLSPQARGERPSMGAPRLQYRLPQ